MMYMYRFVGSRGGDFGRRSPSEEMSMGLPMSMGISPTSPPHGVFDRQPPIIFSFLFARNMFVTPCTCDVPQQQTRTS